MLHDVFDDASVVQLFIPVLASRKKELVCFPKGFVNLQRWSITSRTYHGRAAAEHMVVQRQ
jgi:hypothetical protein